MTGIMLQDDPMDGSYPAQLFLQLVVKGTAHAALQASLEHPVI